MSWWAPGTQGVSTCEPGSQGFSYCFTLPSQPAHNTRTVPLIQWPAAVLGWHGASNAAADLADLGCLTLDKKAQVKVQVQVEVQPRLQLQPQPMLT